MLDYLPHDAVAAPPPAHEASDELRELVLARVQRILGLNAPIAFKTALVPKGGAKKSGAKTVFLDDRTDLPADKRLVGVVRDYQDAA